MRDRLKRRPIAGEPNPAVIFCRVQRIEVSKSAALGAALQAAHGWLTATNKSPKWEKIVAGFTTPIAGSEIQPDKKATKIYDKMLEKYAACESDALDGI
jgi:sugar (pentulose or hexulose) kinase